MEIYFTVRAAGNFRSIKDYIELKFGETTSLAFEKKLKHFLEILKNFPEMGSLEVPEKAIRGFQFTKQTRIFYRIKGNQIIILTLLDVRQNPDKKQF